jgi:hypothetical protein
MYRRYFLLVLTAAFLLLQGCGSSGDSEAPLTGLQSAGKVDVSITDAPAFGFDHVWITVRDLWFHKQDSAEPEQNGWIKFPLSVPVTLDLLELGNGAISVPVWEDIELPEGDYTQMRVFLVRTEAPLADSAEAENPPLTFNNQVDVTGDTAPYPLRVPNADRGIMLTGQFTVKKNEKLKLAVDFDAGHDVVEIERNSKTEFVLKPRLAYFNLDNAGAIVGSIDTIAAADPSAHFVIKAEQIAPNGEVHIVRRVTAADRDGNFVLFPLLPGSYDLVIRGINYETVIVKGVPVAKGTKPQLNPTLAPTITMNGAVTPDYALNGSIISPTGAWVHFLQTLPGQDEKPYEIRFRHFNPLTGQFHGFLMSSDPLQVGAYDASSITLSSVTPVEGNGGYKAMVNAPRYIPSDYALVSSSTATLSFGTLDVAFPATARTVSGSIIVPQTFAPGFLDSGILFASHGGMIVNAIRVDGQMASGGTYTIGNLPGGTIDHPLPVAFYGIEAEGWSASNLLNRAIATPSFVGLTDRNAAGIDLTMEMLP